MRKLIIAVLLGALLIPSFAAAEQDYLLDLGPYCFDASGCSLYSYYDANSLTVDYPVSEAYAGYGIGSYYLLLQYYTYPEMGTTYEFFVSEYDTRNNWEIGYYGLELYYGKHSTSDAYLSYEAEPVDPMFSPACALFTASISENYGGGSMAGAMFITRDGILFFECHSFTGDPAHSRLLRDEMLLRLRYQDAPVRTDTPDPEAPAEIPVSEKGQPVDISIGYGTGYTFSLEGYNSLDTEDPNALIAEYDNMVLIAMYYDYKYIDFGEDLAALSPEDAAARLLELDYISQTGEGLTYEIITAENEGANPLLFNGIMGDDYGGGYILGAVLASDEGLLTIDIIGYSGDTYYDDLEFFREDLLEQITYAE